MGGRSLHTTKSIAQIFVGVVFDVSSHLYDFCCVATFILPTHVIAPFFLAGLLENMAEVELHFLQVSARSSKSGTSSKRERQNGIKSSGIASSQDEGSNGDFIFESSEMQRQRRSVAVRHAYRKVTVS